MALEMVDLYCKASDLFGDFLVDYDVSINDSSYSNVFLQHDVLYECQLKESPPTVPRPWRTASFA